MILDTLDNLNFYFGLSKGLDCALSVLKHYNLDCMRPGEYPDFPIEGCGTVLRIFEPARLGDEEAVPWEYHYHHIDVQYVLGGGEEIIGYTPRAKLSHWEYDAVQDTAYTTECCECLPIRLKERDFAVFFPQDAHRKLHSEGGPNYRKVVFKVPVIGFKVSL